MSSSSSSTNSRIFNSSIDLTANNSTSSISPSSKKLAHYTAKLSIVQDLLSSIQSSLQACHEKSHQYFPLSLKLSNSKILKENQELKRRLLLIEKPKTEPPVTVKAPSNISLRTQATDWFLSKEESFSVSSCSSVDSVVILKEQVENIKEMKTVKRGNERSCGKLHAASNSIQSNVEARRLLGRERESESLSGRDFKPARVLDLVMIAAMPALRF